MRKDDQSKNSLNIFDHPNMERPVFSEACSQLHIRLSHSNPSRIARSLKRVSATVPIAQANTSTCVTDKQRYIHAV